MWSRACPVDRSRAHAQITKFQNDDRRHVINYHSMPNVGRYGQGVTRDFSILHLVVQVNVPWFVGAACVV